MGVEDKPDNLNRRQALQVFTVNALSAMALSVGIDPSKLQSLSGSQKEEWNEYSQSLNDLVGEDAKEFFKEEQKLTIIDKTSSEYPPDWELLPNHLRWQAGGEGIVIDSDLAKNSSDLQKALPGILFTARTRSVSAKNEINILLQAFKPIPEEISDWDGVFWKGFAQVYPKIAENENVCVLDQAISNLLAKAGRLGKGKDDVISNSNGEFDIPKSGFPRAFQDELLVSILEKSGITWGELFEMHDKSDIKSFIQVLKGGEIPNDLPPEMNFIYSAYIWGLDDLTKFARMGFLDIYEALEAWDAFVLKTDMASWQKQFEKPKQQAGLFSVFKKYNQAYQRVVETKNI